MGKKVNTTTKKATKQVIEIDNMSVPSIEEIKNSIENVNLEIPTNETLIDIEKKIEDSLTPIIEITNDINALGQIDEELNKEISESSEATKEYIKESIKKSEEIKNKINNALSKTEVNSNMTNWWNGMGYDYY